MWSSDTSKELHLSRISSSGDSERGTSFSGSFRETDGLEMGEFRDTQDTFDEQEEAREKRKAKAKKMNYCKILLLVFIQASMFIPLQTVLLITLRFSMGYGIRGWWGWLMMQVLSFFICLILFMPIIALVSGKLSDRQATDTLKFYCINLVVMNLLMSFGAPSESMFPSAMTSTVLTDRPACQESIEEVKRFFRSIDERYHDDLIEFDPVEIVYGGMPKWFNGFNGYQASAMVVDNTVHYSKEECPSTKLLAHELWHVWQVQSGEMFEEGGIGFWKWLVQQMNERDGMYTYIIKGDGTQNNPWSTFTDFNWEQQAAIVKDAYDRWKGAVWGCTDDMRANEVDFPCKLQDPYRIIMQGRGWKLSA
ncbi:hypothetical protein TL16_g06568 [Triparma laevis f. inornata]|uniref:Uncharacterized protein n=1 Tax=Triparma laevis f. inornata TaxID=1714386 RepID=A0A9W7EDK6_9STRA|nr:hypothetical protein TL16_g06568 [Triparma laevis f. inornata]